MAPDWTFVADADWAVAPLWPVIPEMTAVATVRTKSFESLQSFEFLAGFAADPRGLAIDQIGAHFARKHFVAPVTHMLQQQHSEHDLGRRRFAAASLALLASLDQLLLDDEQQGVIV